MIYPATIAEFRDALLAYVPAGDHEAAIHDAQAATSPVVQAVDVFNTLKGAAGLSKSGLGLLLGAAHLIASGGWHGLAGEAATVLAQRAAQYNEPTQP